MYWHILPAIILFGKYTLNTRSVDILCGNSTLHNGLCDNQSEPIDYPGCDDNTCLSFHPVSRSVFSLSCLLFCLVLFSVAGRKCSWMLQMPWWKLSSSSTVQGKRLLFFNHRREATVEPQGLFCELFFLSCYRDISIITCT